MADALDTARSAITAAENRLRDAADSTLLPVTMTV